MKRYISIDKQAPPKKLVSNWPDLGNPLDLHTKAWRYTVMKGDRQISPAFKDKGKALELMRQYRFERGIWLHSNELTDEELYQERANKRTEWRWNAGFGA